MRLLSQPLLLLSLTLTVLTAHAARLDHRSFGPPFNRVDDKDRRILNDSWFFGGNTIVKENFARLTTDRQSKRGFIWSRERVESDGLTAILTFRISGQGKSWFGDGLALWLTDSKKYVRGPNHGTSDKYTGIGVIVDTFRNQEHKGGHKDVSVQWNDGTKVIDDLTAEQKEGCDAAMRYHERSASFDPVFSMSRLKLKIDRTRVSVEVDPNASGEWVQCVDTIIPLPTDWLQSSTMGLTASTGALADNHDVISLDLFSQYDDPDVKKLSDEVYKDVSPRGLAQWLELPNCGTTCMIDILKKEMNSFRISAEHRFTDLQEKTGNMIERLKRREHENERRVRSIEYKLNKKVDVALDESDGDLEVEVDVRIANQLETNPHITGSGGWKMPFFLLFTILAGVAFFVHRKYTTFMKSHLL